MNQNSFLHRLETLGYYPLPRPHAKSPGYSGLLVVLRQEPQGHEPQRLQLRLHEWDGKTTNVNLRADMDQPISHTVCPGQIKIYSQREREATFYSFGGALESEVLAGETVYSLRSAAPVLELVPEGITIADQLADETEALFARVEAQQRLSSQQMLDGLVKAGPQVVYQAVLQSLLPEIEAIDHSLRYADFAKMLECEQNWYRKRGYWPRPLHDLATLLQEIGES